VVILRDVHEGCGLQRTGQVPACSRSGCEALVCGDPYNTPHTDGELQGRKRSGRVTSWKNRCAPAESLKVDGDGGLRQDGEGWTPQSLHQSECTTTTIYYRPLSSEELRCPSH
jgi:hypothetical protein